MRRYACLAALIGMVAGMTANAPLEARRTELKIAGSTTVLPLSQVWAETLAKKNPNLRVTVSGGGSGTGLSMLLNGTCAVANSSRPARKREIDSARSRNMKLVETKLAKDGLAIIVHPSNDVKNLTLDQISGIYQGKITTWQQAGSKDNRPILAVGRDSSSGTHGFFQDHVLKGNKYRKEMLALASNAAVAQSVAQSPGAIGYVGLAFAQEAEKANKAKIISVSRKRGEPGLRPTEASVKDGSYPIFRFLYAYTIGPPRGAAADYLKFALSDEGQALVKNVGYLPLK